MALTGRTPLLALLGALVVGLAAPSWTGVLLVTLAVLALAGLDVALAAAVRPLELSRAGDRSARLGEQAQVELVVANRGRRRARGLVRDAWPPSAGAQAQRHRLDVAPGERARLTTVLRPTRRGDRAAYRVTVRTLGPLGLAGRQRSRQLPWTVRVLPPFASRRHLPAKLAQLREIEGRAAVMVRGQGTEFDSLREYVPGDDVRSIDWRATARRSEVTVRTWRPERDRRVLLVLDTGRTSAGRVGDAPRLDACMDAALLLAALAARGGDRVDLLAYDRRVRARVENAAAPVLLASLVDAMAPLEAELVETDLAGMAATVLARPGRRSLVVLLTGLETTPVEEGLLPVLGRLLHRHTVLVAAVADPRVAQLAAGRGDAAEVYGAASAERSRVERARLVELLGRRGVEVVDALPDELAPALADRYLALKAGGRL
ncbi:DUF58 domain-containing protein [Motilibacter aurantiacus]|uniref:DUF58 domain-containing protein n=1 Tax=Motilibacter aurantiacus TaxID=2714955 RepID=UPI00140A96BE|nr:DUF58 domain-containing protein [Motilibacter aurantiacus]NHC43737.1 DUF58 domain-containing protein [Motilibacter aurantiacus]